MPGDEGLSRNPGSLVTPSGPDAGYDLDTAAAIVEAAGRAPSIHNTQPWRWQLRDGALLLRADRSRQLDVADPDGHSLLISCGAALSLAALAAEGGAGRPAKVERFPDAADPDLLARLTSAGPQEPSGQALQDLEAALARASDRRPFSREAVDQETLEQLRAAARAEDAYVDFPHGRDKLIALAVAVSFADREERDDEAYQAEMRRWLRDPAVHPEPVDGVVATAVPHVQPGHARHTDVPVRDFELGVGGAQLIEQDADEYAVNAVVMTPGDQPVDHLAAGEALMRLTVAAQRRGLASCPLSQPVDLAAFRVRLQNSMGWVGVPQMMLRIGHPTGALLTPSTPRRPVSAVLDAWGPVPGGMEDR